MSTNMLVAIRLETGFYAVVGGLDKKARKDLLESAKAPGFILSQQAVADFEKNGCEIRITDISEVECFSPAGEPVMVNMYRHGRGASGRIWIGPDPKPTIFAGVFEAGSVPPLRTPWIRVSPIRAYALPSTQ